MSDAVQVALIGGAFTLLAHYLSGRRSDRNRGVVVDKLDVVHKEINGRMGQLISAEKDASKAEGKAEEKRETEEKK